MAVQGGFGIACQIDVSDVLTALVSVLDVDWPRFRKFLAESTGHDSAQGYYEAVATGKRRIEPFRFVLGWDTSQSTHAAVVTAFNSDDPVSFSIADPDGDETIQFECHVEELERMGGQEDAYRAEVLIHPTGPATIT